ncbi:MAG: MMPL family transporter [Pirellulaceae bacterium]
MFDRQSEIIRNYEWFEGEVGPLISVEVIVGFDQDSNIDPLSRVQLISEIHKLLRSVPEVGGVYSAYTVMPVVPTSPGFRQTFRRTIYRQKLADAEKQLKADGLVVNEPPWQFWRITAKVPALHAQDYGELTDKVQTALALVRDQIGTDAGVEIEVTGLSPVFNEAQRLLLSDLAKSFLVAFLFIWPVLMIVLRSVTGGTLAMIPNVAPVISVFGFMGWFGVPLDIASVLTASVAMGIAVDDTLHFLTWFRKANWAFGQNRLAIEFAFSKCAKAMFHTTLVCCAAMIAFIPNEFVPTRGFAILMISMLIMALIGDLILLPSMLSSRLGSWIWNKHQSPELSNRKSSSSELGQEEV